MNKISTLSVALRRLRTPLGLIRPMSACHPLIAPTDHKRLIHTGSGIRFTKVNASTTEKVVGNSVKYDFMAETKQLLNIVAKSLYSEKEVFVRELISNASDAIEKLKYIQLTSNTAADTDQVPFEIQIAANDMNNTLTIQDTGVGMSKEDLIKNLGTIAHSGSKVANIVTQYWFSEICN